MNHPDYPALVPLLLAGHWREGSHGQRKPIVNPANDRVIGEVACATTSDIEEAVQAAARGFHVWRAKPAMERRSVMHRAAQLLRERSQTVAVLLTLEQGKPLAEALAELHLAAEVIDWFADEGCRIYGRIVPARNLLVQQQVIREPVGPIAAFTPWNFPVNQVVRKLAAALATGCSIVIKPAEETPASPVELVRCFIDAGVPPEVIGLVYGEPAAISAQLIAAPQIRKISFTGSTLVGKQLAALAGHSMKRVTMELGGHAPVIVSRKADPVHAAQTIAATKYRNAGQICASPTRMLVDESIHDRFVAALAESARALKLGHGLDPSTTMGPLANSRRLSAMQELTADAAARGGCIVEGGVRTGLEGNFFAPTIISQAPTDAKVWQEEPFGPIAITRATANLDEAIAEANRLPYGLAAFAFTSDLSEIQRITHEVQCGLLWFNHTSPAWPEMPLCGTRDSGYGSEGGPEALEPYLITKSVSVMGR